MKNKSVLISLLLLAASVAPLLVVQLAVAMIDQSRARLPGTEADLAALRSIRAGEQKMYPQCRSLGSYCTYENICTVGSDGSGCENTDACGSCSGGTNAACIGPLETTKCITDTIRCCTLYENCQLTTQGCACKNANSRIDINNLYFCSGS
jgi:hypothetical protein